MKKIALSLVTIVGMSSLGFAGGDIIPVIPVVVEEDQSAFYLGLGIAAVSNRNSEVSMDFTDIKDGQDRTGNVTFVAGYEYNQYIAFEGRYSTSFADEDQIEMSGWSIFLKPQYTFEDENGEKNNFTIYALLGFGGVIMEGIDLWEVDVDDTGFQWGIGASYSFKEDAEDPDISIFVDYTNLANEMDGLYYKDDFMANTDAITVGISYKF